MPVNCHVVVLWILIIIAVFVLQCMSVSDNCGVDPIKRSTTLYVTVNCLGPWPDFSDKSFPHAPYVYEIVFEDCNFTRVPKNAFQIFVAMERLYMTCSHKVSELRFEEGSMDFLPKLHTLVMKENNLKPMPKDAFCHLPKLEMVFLEDNSIADTDILGFGAHCPGLTSNSSTCTNNIKILVLKRNNITHLPSRTFCSLTNLNYLDITFCGLESIDENAFFNLGSLQNLDISDNNLTTIPEMALSHLTGLYTVDLANNEFLNISGFLKHIPNLKGLYLPNTGLEKLEKDSFQGLSKLESLMLYKNRFEYVDVDVFAPLIGLPDDVHEGCEEDAIQRLVFGGDIAVLNEKQAKVVNVTGLRYLNFDRNNFTTIPSVKALFKLQIFSIAKNRITVLGDDDVSPLHKLQRLNLASNNIKYISDKVFRNLVCLKQLLLNHNSIKFINATAFDDNISLLELYLQDNQISSIEGIFKKNVNLQKLDLSNNRLEVISFEMFPLSIRELNISSNFLNIVGARDGVFPPHLQIHTLDLSSNKLKFITNTFFPMSLMKLYLHDNEISSIDTCTFCSMGGIQSITLHNNRLKTILPEAFQVSVSLILQRNPTVTLLGNPVVCDCQMQNFKNRIIEAGFLSILNVTILQCHRQYLKENQLSVNLIEAVTPGDFLCQANHEQNKTVPESCFVYHDLSWNFVIVDCTDRNLTKIPVRIPSQAFELYLDGNHLGKLSSVALRDLTNLTKLFLNDSRLYQIEDHAFAGLKNLSILHLENNELQSLNPETFTGLNKLIQLYLYSNNLKHLDENTFRPLVALQTLQLNNNEIVSFPVWKLRELTLLRNVSLSQNPWSCDCHYIQNYREWLQKFASKVTDVNSLFCKFNDNSISDVPLIAYNASYCYVSTATILQSKYFPLLTCLVTLLVLLAIAALLLFMYRREIQVLIYSRYGIRLFHKDVIAADRAKIYDAFLCYSSNDEQFVVEQLIPKLEGIDPPFHLCIHQRDFLVGGYITDNILEAVSKSRRSILVLSDNFVQSEFCRFEFKTAYVQMLRDRCNRVIVIVLGEIPQGLIPEMELYLKTNTYITWGDKLFWERLYFAMPDRNPVTSI